jgi:archaetidylinositol phosphate synthase
MVPGKVEKRMNDTLLQPFEKTVLQWVVARLPDWVTPDLLTAAGFSGSVIIFIGYYLTNYDHSYLWLASLGFLINWFGDSLDGTLARFRKIERPKYGFFIDHSVDSICEVLVFTSIGLSPYVDFQISLLALVGYLLLSNLVFIKTNVDGIFRISWAKFGPTEMRALAVIANTIIFYTGNPLVRLPFGQWSLYNLIISAVTISMFSAYILFTIKQAVHLAKLDPVKTKQANTKLNEKVAK